MRLEVPLGIVGVLDRPGDDLSARLVRAPRHVELAAAGHLVVDARNTQG